EALATSPMVGKPLREVALPRGILVGAIVRKGEVIIPRGETEVQVGDHVILFVRSDLVKKVEQMFRVSLQFFCSATAPGNAVLSRIAYVNGRYLRHAEAAVHIEDRGYQFADGVYEVCGLRDGKLMDERLHME